VEAVSEDLSEEEALVEALAVYDRELGQDPRRWAWWQAAVLFAVGGYALTTQNNWWCAGFALALAGICYEHPKAMRDANLEGYAAGWRRRRATDEL